MSEILSDIESYLFAAPATLEAKDWLTHGYHGLKFVGLILCKGKNKLILSHFFVK